MFWGPVHSIQLSATSFIPQVPKELYSQLHDPFVLKTGKTYPSLFCFTLEPTLADRKNLSLWSPCGQAAKIAYYIVASFFFARFFHYSPKARWSIFSFRVDELEVCPSWSRYSEYFVVELDRWHAWQPSHAPTPCPKVDFSYSPLQRPFVLKRTK